MGNGVASGRGAPKIVRGHAYNGCSFKSQMVRSRKGN